MMIKIMAILTRKQGMTQQEFKDYCLNVDQPLVMQLSGVNKFTYSFVTEISRGNQHIDGYIELWFDNAQALDKAFATPIGQKLIENEHDFLNVDKLTVYNVEEHAFSPNK